MAPFEELLKESVAQHGHKCAGQIIGVRMAMLGCRLVGINDPLAPQFRKKLIVYVEIDRCATDAIMSVTGCRMGKRTLKFRDFGINAATFVNLETQEAFRIISTESSRETCQQYALDQADPKQRQIEGYTKMPDDLLFDIQRVKVDMPETDMPGPPRQHAVCSRCGQMIRDGRERHIKEQILCRPCAGEGYYHLMESHPPLDGRGPSLKEITS